MDTNTKKSPSELLEEAQPYDSNDPELNQFDGADPYRMLATIKKELDEGKYQNR